MEFQEFELKADELFEKLKRQHPLAILQFGSSLREEDYLPGISDVDAFVLSEQPLQDNENEVGFNYIYMTPKRFVNRLGRSNAFILCALLTGKIVYDPRGFLASVHELCHRGLALTPTHHTILNCACSIGNQLSSAMNRYLSTSQHECSATHIRRNLHKLTTSLAMVEIMNATETYVSGYTAVHRALQALQSDLLAPLELSRRNLIEGQTCSGRNHSQTLILDQDALGTEILAVEQLFIERGGSVGVAVRKSTNDLICAYQQEYGTLERIDAVRVDNLDLQHLILAQRSGNWQLFGFRIQSGRAVRIVEPIKSQDVPTIVARLRIIK